MTTETEISMDTLARTYIRIRGHLQELEREHEERVKALKEQQQMLCNEMKDRMLKQGGTSMKTVHGTVILSEKTRYFTQDWDAFKTFMVEHDALDLLEKRIAQGNMKTFLEANPDKVPPGLSSETEYQVTVRKPS